MANTKGNVRGRDVEKGGRRRWSHRVDGDVAGGAIAPQREDACSEAMNGTEMGMAGPSVTDSFAADPIFLAVESQGSKRRSQKFVGRTLSSIEGARANPQADVAEAELGTARGAQIFPGAEEEVETDDQTNGGGVGDGAPAERWAETRWLVVSWIAHQSVQYWCRVAGSAFAKMWPVGRCG